MNATNFNGLDPIIGIRNVIREALEEMDLCPDDSIQDIWNEKLEEWGIGMRMDSHYNIN